MTSTEVVSREVVELPDMSDINAVTTFRADLTPHLETRGYTSLYKHLGVYLGHMLGASDAQKRVKRSLNYINGVRSTSARKGAQKRTLAYHTQKMLEKLSTPALRAQCELFGVDYDAHESQEDIISILVEKQVALSADN